MDRVCDWCGRPAVVNTYRTLYEGTEYEQTSSYFECAECNRLPKDMVGRYQMLATFPDDDADYCKWFVVEKEWLEKQCKNLEEFLENYTWDETWPLYLLARAEDRLISEGIDK